MSAGGSYRRRIRRLRHSLRLGGPIAVLSAAVLFPAVLIASVAIVALALWETPKDLVLGILALSLAAAAVSGAIIVTVLLGRRARLARLQADLLGNVSHELKTPLAAIRMYAETLQSGVVANDPKLVRECVEATVRETEWLQSMIERLLTWRAAARDRAALEFETGPLAPVVNDVSRRFRRMFRPDEVEFLVSVDTCLPVAHDRTAVESVLLNLLINAYKYTGQTKRISLSARDQGDHVEVIVEDNGGGIPGSQLKRIFEPFYRVETSGRPAASGSGLGLAIVDVTVRAMGGTVGVVSEPGRGSTFTVSLPAAEPGTVADGEITAPGGRK